MATKTELDQQLRSTGNALAILRKQLAAAKPGSAEQTQLSISIYDLEQQRTSIQQQLSTFLTPSSNPSTAQQAQATNDAKPLSEPVSADVNAGRPAVAEGVTVGETSPPAQVDPFEQARLDAIANEQAGPTEQEVLNSASDAQLTAEEQSVLEAGQADNRAQLKTEVDAGADPAVVDHGPAYDDDGNLMPGFALDENNNPVWVGGNFVEPATAASAAASREAATKNVSSKTQQTNATNDWRVRLRLAPNAAYLYKAKPLLPTDILAPLLTTDGVIFPYMPTVNVNYRANYDAVDITHTNYKTHFYKNSSVDDVTITADFTAQDTTEAKYMLAVIHFFKSVTKMFYGQDVDPRGGTPPPLCYLSGLGAYQFNNHPMLITSFAYNLPNDVDYVRTEVLSSWADSGLPTFEPKDTGSLNVFNKVRLAMSGLNKGAARSTPAFKSLTSISKEVTYVPTKLQLTITAVPVVSRAQVSKEFSLKNYATGNLTKKGFW